MSNLPFFKKSFRIVFFRIFPDIRIPVKHVYKDKGRALINFIKNITT